MSWAPEWVSSNEESLLEELELLGESAGTHRGRALEGYSTAHRDIWIQFEAYLVVASYLHRHCSIEWRSGEGRETRFDVLVELYAQSLQVSEEIGLLIRSGFISSARARWRTLFELVVYAHVVVRGPRSVASRYVASQVVEARAALVAGDWANALNPSHKGEFDEAVGFATRLEREYERVIKSYGLGIRDRYGWAVPAIKERSVTFGSLIRYADLPGWLDWQATYVSASKDVHAGRVGSIRSLVAEQIGSSFHYTPRLQETFAPTYELMWTIQTLTALVAGETYARAFALEPLYWAELCELLAIDIANEGYFRNAQVRAGLSWSDLKS